MLTRLARTCYHRRRFVLLAWLLALVALSGLGRSVGGKFRTDFRPPSSESRQALNLLQKAFPQRSGSDASIVFKADAGVDDPGIHSTTAALFATISQQSGAAIVSPYSAEGAKQISPDRRVAYAKVLLPYLTPGQKSPQVDVVRSRVVAARHTPGLQLELGGQVFQEKIKPPASEAVGLLAAIVILLIAFGSVLAMGLPIMVALFGIVSAAGVIEVLARVLSVPDFTTQLAAMIGLGVGIDYALFIVSRYRAALHDGKTAEQAVVISITTAGRAVVFAGTTVVISLLGMFLMGLSFVRGLAVGASIAVLLTMLASITLLPAVLGFTGKNIDKMGLPHRKVRHSHRASFWYRWSRLIQRRPWRAVLAGLVVLVALAIPLFSIQLGSSDAGNLPRTDTTRRAYDLLSQGFGSGFNGPLLLAAGLPTPADVATITHISDVVGSTPGIAFASPPVLNAKRDVAVVYAYPTTSPQDVHTTELIQTLRHRVLPAATAGTGLKVLVGGTTASIDDFSTYLSHRLPYFIGAVLLLSFLLLMTVFRSLLVPLKAVVVNLLSIGAAYGVVVAVFQWGWGRDIIGLGKQGPIDAFIPMMLFAIVFGLSMDYEVFLLSRMREEYDRTGDNALAVADGLSATARVITAAAAIMVCVFGSFVLGDQRQIKLFGLGLAAAVLIDATLVRLVLVPATMELLGERNWWIPRWLDRILPKIDVEGHDLDVFADPDDRDDPEFVGAGRGPLS